jgi:hypothetical protein
VYASAAPLPVAVRNTHYQAARYALPGRDLPPQDRAGFSPAHAGFSRNPQP